GRRLVAYVVPGDGELPSEGAADHVAHWQGVWDEAYARPPALPDPALNTNGWNSSYTGLPIPEAEMREWVDHTVAPLPARRAARVAEAGCGTGPLLARLAPHCAHYDGPDVSEQAIRYLEQLPRLGSGLSVILHRQAADDFTGFDEGQLDAVVLSSVVQYFP